MNDQERFIELAQEDEQRRANSLPKTNNEKDMEKAIKILELTIMRRESVAKTLGSKELEDGNVLMHTALDILKSYRGCW